MAEFKNILLMMIIAVLFSVLTYSLGNVHMEKPKYEDYCNETYYPVMPTKALMKNNTCPEIRIPKCKGNLKPIINDKGCVKEYECDNCLEKYKEAREKFSLIIFLYMSIIGIIGIITALIKDPGEEAKKKEKKETIKWILNGFLLGGLISLFFGTIIYYGSAPRWLRPIIISTELVIVIIVAIRKTTEKNNKKRNK